MAYFVSARNRFLDGRSISDSVSDLHRHTVRLSFGHRILVLSQLLLTIAGSLPNAGANESLRTVVHSNYLIAVDGTPFNGVSKPVLNNLGQTAFTARGEDRAVLLSEAGAFGVEIIIENDQKAPGLPDGTISSLYSRSANLSDSGVVSIAATLRGSAPTGWPFELSDFGLWSGGGGRDVSLVAYDRGLAPGTDGAVFEASSTEALLNSDGRIAIPGLLDANTPESTNLGIWSDRDGGGLKLIVREGDPFPGMEGRTFTYISTNGMVMNDPGDIAFTAGYFDLNDPGDRNNAIWLHTQESGLIELVTELSPVPDKPSGSFDGFFGVSLNNSRNVVFQSAAKEFGEDYGTDVSIWAGSKGDLRLVATAGAQASGVDGEFSYFRRSLINGMGDTCFSGVIAGDEERGGIWSEGPGDELHLIAIDGGVAADTGGATFKNVGLPTMNGKGQVAFLGLLAITEAPSPNEPRRLNSDSEPVALVSYFNDVGIWAQDSKGVLRLIVREGQSLDIAQGPDVDMRVVSAIDFVAGTGNEDGRPSGFNDYGQLAFWARFTDGTQGVFVSNLVAVPEPASMAFMLLAIVAASVVHRRR